MLIRLLCLLKLPTPLLRMREKKNFCITCIKSLCMFQFSLTLRRFLFSSISLFVRFSFFSIRSNFIIHFRPFSPKLQIINSKVLHVKCQLFQLNVFCAFVSSSLYVPSTMFNLNPFEIQFCVMLNWKKDKLCVHNTFVIFRIFSIKQKWTNRFVYLMYSKQVSKPKIYYFGEHFLVDIDNRILFHGVKSFFFFLFNFSIVRVVWWDVTHLWNMFKCEFITIGTFFSSSIHMHLIFQLIIKPIWPIFIHYAYISLDLLRKIWFQ